MSVENKAAIRLFIAEIIKRLRADIAGSKGHTTSALADAAIASMHRYALVRFRQLADAIMQEWK